MEVAERDRLRADVTAGQRVAAHAIVDAFDRRDHLRALAKATPGYVPSARLVDSEQAAEALAAPVSRAAFVPAPTPAPAAEHHDDELAAAAAAGDVNWLDRLNTEAVAKAFARDRRRLPRSIRSAVRPMLRGIPKATFSCRTDTVTIES